MNVVGRVRKAGLALALVAGGLAAGAAGAESVPEPDGYRMDDYRAPTPATLKGAKVVDTVAAHALWKAGEAVFVDAMPRPPKPANLPPNTVWRDLPRDSVPGAVWLANVGFGSLSDQADTYFRRGLDTAAKSNPERPLVFFCLRNCWMSWNAGKRAMAYGYRNIFWFPDGTDGWAEAALPVERVEPWTE